jgi:hypothetical protein
MRTLSAATSGPVVEQIDEVDIAVPANTAGNFSVAVDVPIEQVVAPGSVGYAQFADPPATIPVIIVGVNNATAGHLAITMFYLGNYAGATVRLHYSLKEHGQ